MKYLKKIYQKRHIKVKGFEHGLYHLCILNTSSQVVPVRYRMALKNKNKIKQRISKRERTMAGKENCNPQCPVKEEINKKATVILEDF